jgi:hypothetical protein
MCLCVMCAYVCVHARVEESKMNECKKWLEEYLRGHGMVLCETVRAEAAKLGFKKTELKQARVSLGVKCWNDWAANEDGTQNWFWYLEG